MTLRSCLYAGHVVHHRLRPRKHRLRHNVFWLLLDLDELDQLDKHLRLFSWNRFNVLSFHDRDHGDGSSRPVREQVLDLLEAASIDTHDIAVTLLCMPRVLGYDFNPISVYYCTRRRDGTAVAMIYEVNNTFRQRHMYVMAILQSDDAVILQSNAKTFYVSPFLDLQMSYRFKTALPDETVHLSVQGRDQAGPMIDTALLGRRRPLTDGTLASVLALYPLITLRVVGWIHWHALRMWLKGFKLQERPPTPKFGVTIARTHKSGTGS